MEDAYAFHQTPAELAKLLIKECDIKDGSSILEPFKGEGAFYDNFPSNCDKYWCEIEHGVDYTTFEKSVDWVITNPPFRLEQPDGGKRINAFWKILEYYATNDRVRTGIAFLGNDSCLGTLTPRRIEILNNLGWYINKIKVCAVKKWRGRYFFIILTKTKSDFYTTINKTF
jgi:hypothetical protein